MSRSFDGRGLLLFLPMNPVLSVRRAGLARPADIKVRRRDLLARPLVQLGLDILHVEILRHCRARVSHNYQLQKCNKHEIVPSHN